MGMSTRALALLIALFILPALACQGLSPASPIAPPVQTIQPATAVGGTAGGDCSQNIGRIVFSYDPKDLDSVHYGIYVMGADGTNPVRLSSQEAINHTEPAWSPDRCAIAFSAFTKEGDHDIYVMAADGSSIRRMTTDPARDIFPDWSPDGKQISFISYRDGYRNVYVMNADGSDQRQVTTNKGEYSQWQQWSPNGDLIAFTYNPGGNRGTSVYVVKPDGTGLRELVPPSGNLGDREPAWSPDGQVLYVMSNRSAYMEIWKVNLDGSGLTQLTSFGGTPTPDHSLRVSPDGKFLAFYGTGPEVVNYGTEIYVVNADGTGLKDITHLPGADEWLDW